MAIAMGRAGRRLRFLTPKFMAEEVGSREVAGSPRPTWVLGLQLAATAVVTWFLFRIIGVQLADLASLSPDAWRPDFVWLAASCAMLLVGYAVSGLIWGAITGDLGGPSLKPGSAIRVYMVANLGRYIPGKVWQIAGLAALSKRLGVTPAVATGAAVSGQLASLSAAALVGAVALEVASDEAVRLALWLGLAGLVGALAFLPPFVRPVLRLWLRLFREAVPDEWAGRMPTVRWPVLYAVNWLLYGAAFWMLLQSFDALDVSFAAAVGAFTSAYVLGYVAFFAPAGLGVREGFLTLFLMPLIGQGLAAAVAIIARLWTTAVEVVPAAALWVRDLQLRQAAVDPVGGSGGEGT